MRVFAKMRQWAANYEELVKKITSIKHPNQKIAVRVVSQFGEESTKVVGVGRLIN